MQAVFDTLSEDRRKDLTHHKLTLITSIYYLVQSYVDPFQLAHAIHLYNLSQSSKVVQDLHSYQPSGCPSYMNRLKEDIALVKMTDSAFNPVTLEAKKAAKGMSTR